MFGIRNALIFASAVLFLLTLKSLIDGKGSDTGLWRRDNDPAAYWTVLVGGFAGSALLLTLAVVDVR